MPSSIDPARKFRTYKRGEVRTAFPGLESATPFELFGDDSVLSLERRLLIEEAEPDEPSCAISDHEFMEALTCCGPQPLPPRAHTRLGKLYPAMPKKKGRPRTSSKDAARRQQALDLYEEFRGQFASARNSERRALGIRSNLERRSIGDAALKRVKEMYYPHICERSVANLLSRARREKANEQKKSL